MTEPPFEGSEWLGKQHSEVAEQHGLKCVEFLQLDELEDPQVSETEG
jgi:hypothetical protein